MIVSSFQDLKGNYLVRATHLAVCRHLVIVCVVIDALIIAASHVLLFDPCFVMQYIVIFIVLHSSRRAMDCWLFNSNCL